MSIPPGWAVCDNKFYDVDPVVATETDDSFIENWYQGFTEDVLWIDELRWQDGSLIIPQTQCFSVDLGWYPDSRADGEYCLRLQWNGKDGATTVAQLTSRSRHEIRKQLEHWLYDIKANYAEYCAKYHHL